MDIDHVGLIGVGHIGSRLAERFLDAGYDLTAHDVDDERAALAAEMGADTAESPAAVTAAADAVVLSLPGAPEVEAVMESTDGVFEELADGQPVVDTSTTGPATAERYAEACPDRGGRFVAAPLTGGGPGDGYHLLVGGDPDDCAAVGDILDAAGEHRRVGDAGDAQRFKLTIQVLYAAREAVEAETVAFARDAGVDPRLMNEFLELGVDDRLFDRDYEQSMSGLGGLAIWHKDVGYALDVATEAGTATPLAAAVHEAYKHGVRAAGPGEGDAATILRYWEALNR